MPLTDLGPWQDIDYAPGSSWGDRLPNFKPFELRQRSDGRVYVDFDFLDKLQALRTAYGKGMEVSSYYRSPAYNARVSDTGYHGPHTTGHAIDIIVCGHEAHLLLQAALDPALLFTGIGVNQRGPQDKRFLHLDDLPNGDGRPRPWIWSY